MKELKDTIASAVAAASADTVNAAGAPAWSMRDDFDAILRNGKRVKLMPNHGFGKAKSVTFVKDGLAVTTTMKGSSPTVRARFRCGDGFSAHSGFIKKTTAKKLELTGFLRFHRWSPAKPAAPKTGK